MLRLKICAFFILFPAIKGLFWAVLAGIPGLPIMLGAIIGWALFITSVPSPKFIPPTLTRPPMASKNKS